MQYVIGIDEVGRGSLAGPVVVAAVATPANGKWLRANSKWQIANGKLGKLRDSKKLSAKQREAWFEYFKTHLKVDYAIARVYPRQIEERNISRAANLAAERAYRRLIANSKSQIDMRYAIRDRHMVYLDGGLYLGNHRSEPVRKKTRKSANVFRVNSQSNSQSFASTVIRGDEKIKAIAAASIVAKVHRDGLMVRLAKKYPQYGFEAHKGYGTRAHMRAIRRHGASRAHRSTFLKSC